MARICGQSNLEEIKTIDIDLKEDYYRILGLEFSKKSQYKQKNIQEAYIKKRFEYHPDRHNSTDAYKELFQKLGKSCVVLYNPESRKYYDSNAAYTKSKFSAKEEAEAKAKANAQKQEKYKSKESTNKQKSAHKDYGHNNDQKHFDVGEELLKVGEEILKVLNIAKDFVYNHPYTTVNAGVAIVAAHVVNKMAHSYTQTFHVTGRQAANNHMKACKDGNYPSYEQFSVMCKQATQIPKVVAMVEEIIPVAAVLFGAGVFYAGEVLHHYLEEM